MPSFYAEELGNINALRVTLSLDTDCNVAEELQIVNNTLILENKLVADLNQVGLSVHTQDLVITQPPSGGNTWEIKLNLSQPPQKLRSQQVEVQEWWSSKILKENSFKGLACFHCHQDLINDVSYQIKDLPSEHWYELVECWICHEEKPEEHRERLRPILAKEDLLLVGTTYFLLHPRNLIAGTIKDDTIVAGRVNWNRGTMTKWIAINCSECHQPLGEGNYEMQDFFVCDLINAAKIHATHRFLIQGRQSERIYSLVSVFIYTYRCKVFIIMLILYCLYLFSFGYLIGIQISFIIITPRISSSVNEVK
ncbi:hypothetical protein K501DRAFT_173388 [Backusella circina FSU 941]|nr:hypothetical protein K501DRAFT_173388 [Backusella circina FSU 941]